MAKPSLLILLLSLSIVSLLLLVVLFISSHPSPPRPLAFAHVPGLADHSPTPPRLAYYISGSDGDGERISRLLRAVYHPRNQYLLHLDCRAAQSQRDDLLAAVRAVPAFLSADNVNVVGRADAVNPAGSSPIAAVLHGAAILLRYSGDWDWFVNLEASDYPLIPQDDFLHVLSFVPRDTNFIQHTSNFSWNEYQRMQPIIVDPGLYLAARRDIFLSSKKRTVPTAYEFFTGSPYMILTHKFVEYSIKGWDNLPRTLLLYFSNSKSSHQGYFHTLACNSKYFREAIVNSNLGFNTWDDTPREEPRDLKLRDFKKMIESGAVFGRSFLSNDPILDKIDASILLREHGRIIPGGWCAGSDSRGRDPCLIGGDPNVLRPGPSARRFEKLLLRLMETAFSCQNSTFPNEVP